MANKIMKFMALMYWLEIPVLFLSFHNLYANVPTNTGPQDISLFGPAAIILIVINMIIVSVLHGRLKMKKFNDTADRIRQLRDEIEATGVYDDDLSDDQKKKIMDDDPDVVDKMKEMIRLAFQESNLEGEDRRRDRAQYGDDYKPVSRYEDAEVALEAWWYNLILTITMYAVVFFAKLYLGPTAVFTMWQMTALFAAGEITAGALRIVSTRLG